MRPVDVQRKLYGRLLFSFSTDSGAFPSFSKGEPGEYPKAPAPSGLTAAGQNGTITLLNGKVRFPLPPLSCGIDRAGRHSFGIAAAEAACILIERKQGPGPSSRGAPRQAAAQEGEAGRLPQPGKIAKREGQRRRTALSGAYTAVIFSRPTGCRKAA